MALTHNQYAVAAITATLCLAGLYTVVGAGLSSTNSGGFESAVEDLELNPGNQRECPPDIPTIGCDWDGDGISNAVESSGVSPLTSPWDHDNDGLRDDVDLDDDSDGMKDKDEIMLWHSRFFVNRRNGALSEECVSKLYDELGMRPGMDTFKKFWDSGQLAIINGIGYPNPNRSHFRSMDIWYTADNENLGQEGWLGKTIRDLDPYAENVLTGVNFGRSLPRAMYAKDVPVSSVGNLDTVSYTHLTLPTNREV